MTNGERAILMISANNAFAHSLRKVFGENGYELTIAAAESSHARLSQHRQPAMVLVDRVSSDPAALRQHPTLRAVPILSFYPPGMNCTDDDCAADLDMGVDISVCNESARQLLARTRAVLRRAQYAARPSGHYEAGGIRIDMERHEVCIRNKPVDLTLKEFQILLQFLRSPNHVFSRQELLNKVWGEDYALEEHALDVHIYSLRRKIEPNPSQPTFIVTVRRVGFKLVAR
jgi:DNA-binding response OmpR family regulator